ncbi:hypothetical protein PYW08_014152 [Mythimna loreyi]|uniref:Uncharacterized protein n=1 Tax=Mythimna loreyi TaxID=667449 RepID=A0ACC2R784_9NEOP|nr:hypothetical protein PYW08_014152 [Mythimna loreyi]
MATAAENVLTNISEMIDLAIGTPEVGVVDFCMLQTVLHCLAQQLRVLGKNVELRGSIATLPVGRQSDNAQTVAITEFIVDTEAPGKYELASYPLPPDQDSVLVVERKRRDDPQVRAMTAASTRTADRGKAAKPSSAASGAATPTPAAYAPGAPAHAPGAPTPAPGAPKAAAPAHGAPTPAAPAPGAPTAAAPAPGAPAAAAPAPAATVSATVPPSQHPSRVAQLGPPPRASVERLSLVTLSKFNLLENTVADLKERVYGTTPKNEEILQEVRSQSNLKAITDMWTNMNVASRLDAAEEGIKKLSSLIEDLIGEAADMQKKLDTHLAQKAETAPSKTSTTPSGHAVKHSTAAPPSQHPPSQHPPSQQPPEPFEFHPSPSMIESWRIRDQEMFASKGELMQLVAHLQSLRDDLDKLTKAFSDAMKDVHPTFVAPAPPPPSKIALVAPPPPTPAPPPAAPRQGPTPPQAPPAAAAPAPLITVITPPTIPITNPSEVQAEHLNKLESRLLDKINQLDREIKKCCDTVRKTEGNFRDQFTSFQDQLEEMTKQMLTTTGQATLTPDLVKDLQGLMALFETVQTMQTQLQQVHETALNLAAEKEDRQNHIDALLEQIELLKVIKLDREDMVEALADKADLRMLARKVSHDQFENACDDLSKGLEHALGKLNVQESLWQQALDDIQREIEQKLDKMELSPVKDFFNNKLKQLQENLKAMAALRREAEAAGTKRRLLRDVNCISCDAKAVMAMDAPPPQPAKPLPANLSMKPYLSYELDAIRKNQASSLPQRNMHDWEHVQQQMLPSKPHKVRSETDKHLCNRYCGGSHTVTTPAQRVARLGHFIKQWGPEVLPLSSGFAAGDDGRLYKISTSEGAGTGPGGASEGAAVCTPKSPAKKPPPVSPKPVVITAECRCLDPTAERPPQQ